MDTKKEKQEIIIGRNAVLEALSGNCIHSVLAAKGANLQKLISKAKEVCVPIKTVDSQKLDSLCGSAKHQGIIALVSEYKYSSLNSILKTAQQKGEPPFLIIADEIEDPHNLGAIIRTAECTGAHGVIIPKRRSAGLNFTVSKTSAGAVEHIPVARVTNLAQTIDSLKQNGIWVYGTDMQGSCWCTAELTGPIALILGNEGKGISRLLKQKCDALLSIPLYGKIGSLNVSVAAGVFMCEIARQRRLINLP